MGISQAFDTKIKRFKITIIYSYRNTTFIKDPKQENIILKKIICLQFIWSKNQARLDIQIEISRVFDIEIKCFKNQFHIYVQDSNVHEEYEVRKNHFKE